MNPKKWLLELSGEVAQIWFRIPIDFVEAPPFPARQSPTFLTTPSSQKFFISHAQITWFLNNIVLIVLKQLQLIHLKS